jgi:two-component system, LytTR family, sensor kinase
LVAPTRLFVARGPAFVEKKNRLPLLRLHLCYLVLNNTPMWFSQKYKSPWLRFLSHAGFWIAYLLINAITAIRYYPDRDFVSLLLQSMLTLPVDVLATYLTVYGLYKWFLFKKKYVLFAITLVGSALFFILLQRAILFNLTYPIFLPERRTVYPFFDINWFYSFTNIYLVVAVVSVIKLSKISFEQQKNAKELDQERIEAELKFLKSQIHPHFLFNTLNNLYALTLDKSDKAPEVVLKLSDLLNYMLYECNEPYMLITKETRLIENYLTLERIRYGEQLDLDFQVRGEIIGKRLAPMLLLPFIENAFKHGVSKVRKEAKVRILLEITGNILHFSVINSRSFLPEKDLAGYSEGIGLKNVKRRLELLYPGKHQLDLSQTDKEFSIHLKIILDTSYES